MALTFLSRLFRKPKTRSIAWDAAGYGKRMRYWQPEVGGINSLLHSHGDTLRNRARETIRNNPYASSIVDTLVANFIGTGIKPQSKVTDHQLRQTIQNVWLQWTDIADAAGLTDFYGLQALVCRSMIEGGECFVRLRVCKPGASLVVPLQLQVLEAEHLNISLNGPLPNGNQIISGIELDKMGKRVAYHLYPEHPGDIISTHQSVRIPANEILHIYRPNRPGQLRGEPWLSNVLLKLHELDQYDDAELMRKKTAAMFTGFITRLDPESNLMGETTANGQGVSFVGLEPGTMQILDPGEDIKFAEPADVGVNYDGFMRQQLRAIAVGVGITYEQLTGDLSNVNYSSIRAGLVEFRRRCAMFQHNLMVFQFCRPIWQRWCSLAVLSGALDAKAVDITPVKWIPQGFDWVDPLKDQESAVMAVRNGFKSRSEVVSELGYDAEEIDTEIAHDQQRADTLGLILDSDPRHQFERGYVHVNP